jgi:thiol-disulfide isomerase/thioredoxin
MDGVWRRRLTCAALWLAGVMSPMWASGAEAALRVGGRAPQLIVPTLDARVFDLAALHGKVVIINFWASWCTPCRAEMPQLDAFYRRYHSSGVELLGLSIDEPGDRMAVARIMKSFSYPAALAAAAQVDGFGPPVAVPMTWIIDAQGIVRARLIAGNAVTEQSLERTVLPLLRRP